MYFLKQQFGQYELTVCEHWLSNAILLKLVMDAGTWYAECYTRVCVCTLMPERSRCSRVRPPSQGCAYPASGQVIHLYDVARCDFAEVLGDDGLILRRRQHPVRPVAACDGDADWKRGRNAESHGEDAGRVIDVAKARTLRRCLSRRRRPPALDGVHSRNV